MSGQAFVRAAIASARSRTRRRFARRVVLLLLGGVLAAIAPLASPERALSHVNDLSVATVAVEAQAAQVELTLPTALVPWADTDADGRLTPEEVQTHRQQLTAFLRDRFRLTDGEGRAGRLTIRTSELAELPPNLQVTAETHSTLDLTYTWSDLIAELTVRYELQSASLLSGTGLPADHCLLTVRQNGQTQTAVLNPVNRELTVAVAPDRLLQPGIWAIAGAFLWGAAHAFSPGHGKTTIGAYLIGERATVRHAFLLGATTTVTHTIGVVALGAIALLASRYVVPEQLFPWLSLVSGAIVTGIGLNLFVRRLPAKHGDRHSHSHDHPHHDHHHHHHAPPAPEVSHWRNVVALGVSGGLVPCPAALVLLLSAIAFGFLSYGLVLVIAFSVGLAATLTGLGLVLLRAKQLFRAVPAQMPFARQLPALSALAIAAVGMAIALRALFQLQFFGLGG